MSRELASVQKITSLEPIKGKDRIELATILGWHVIVKKGDFKVGDLAVYVQYDTILPPRPEFEFLRPRCYSKKYDGFRISNMKMAGVFSEGIVFPMSILDGDCGRFNEGRDVSEELEVQKYDPDVMKEVEIAKNSKIPIIQFLMRYEWFRKCFRKWASNRKPKLGYPTEIHKASEANIQVVFDGLKDQNLLYYKSEKLEGQAATYHITKKGKFRVYSHNVGLPKSDNNWWRVAEKFDIEKRMKQYMKDHRIPEMYIQGEVVGPGIQKNIYKLESLDFYVYDAGDIAQEKVRTYDLEGLEEFQDATNLNLVPILEREVPLPDTCDEVLADCEGKSIFGSTMKNQREGIVWRSMGNTAGFKAKSKKYQAIWNKEDETE